MTPIIHKIERRFSGTSSFLIAVFALLGIALSAPTTVAQPSPPSESEAAAELDRQDGEQSAPIDTDADPVVTTDEATGRSDSSSGRSEANAEVDSGAETSTPTAIEAPEQTATDQAEDTQPKLAVAPDLKKLTIATWPGAFGEAQRDVVIDGFKEEKSVAVRVIERTDTFRTDLNDRDEQALPDAVEFSAKEVDEGCSAGHLLKLSDGNVIASDAAGDFLPGSLKPCGIGSFAWSHIFAVNPAAYKKRQPKSLADVFNSKRFPGKRAFMKQSRFLLEAALMADGVEADEVYDLLETQEGLAQAFEMLDRIRDDILWVDDAKAATSAVAKGDASFGQSFSGRAFFTTARGSPVDIIWDGQIYEMTYWAIPAKSPRQGLARAFLEFATQPQQLAAVAERFPYGPTRTSALPLAKRHVVAGLDLGGYLPTAPENMKTALQMDETWWVNNQNVVDTAFSIWLAKKPKPAAKKERKSPRRN